PNSCASHDAMRQGNLPRGRHGDSTPGAADPMNAPCCVRVSQLQATPRPSRPGPGVCRLFRMCSTQFLGHVSAPDRAAAKIAATEKSNLTEERPPQLGCLGEVTE